jgi:hypothetical protein
VSASYVINKVQYRFKARRALTSQKIEVGAGFV